MNLARRTAEPRKVRRARTANVRLPADLIAGVSLLILLGICSYVIPALSDFSVSELVGTPLAAPNADHPFGTDDVGRDVLVRAFAAARVDLGLAIVGAGVSLFVGATIGVVVTMTYSRLFDSILMRIVDAVVAFPSVILILALVLLFGATTTIGPVPAGVPAIIFAIVVTHWAIFARIARGQALTVRQMDYVEAARSVGMSTWRVTRRYVIPNVFGPSLAYAISDAVRIIVVVAALPFLGAGVEPPAPEWGNMMFEGRAYLDQAWWIALFPGLLLAVAAVAFAMAGEGASRMLSGPDVRKRS